MPSNDSLFNEESASARSSYTLQLRARVQLARCLLLSVVDQKPAGVDIDGLLPEIVDALTSKLSPRFGRPAMEYAQFPQRVHFELLLALRQQDGDERLSTVRLYLDQLDRWLNAADRTWEGLYGCKFGHRRST